VRQRTPENAPGWRKICRFNTGAIRRSHLTVDTSQTRRVSNGEDTHTTLGRNFRTPAHADVLAALGRVLYSFLSLEDGVTAILYDAGAADLSASRAKMAGEKEQALRELAERYRQSSNGHDVASSLDAAADAFGAARETVRNEVLHAHPFTAGEDSAGAYLPGLAYTAKDGKSWKTIARTPEDLLDLAAKVEDAINPLSAARDAVSHLPLSVLGP
jgi:hypothetical protein